jgi:IPT/TIG domain-containing protein
MRTAINGMIGAAAGLVLALLFVPTVEAGSKDGKLAPPASVAKAPTCDPSEHPKIIKVTPDTVKAGEKIMIKGKNFGTKQCFQNVSFGSSTASFSYVNDTTLEATVPTMKSGIARVNVLTEGGSSEYVLLVK